MLIAIPTLGRVNRQRTWERIPEIWLKNTKLFVQAHEYHIYSARYGYENVIGLDHAIKDVANTRDWIISYAHSKNETVLMMDDDLDFAQRRTDDPTKFTEATEQQMLVALEALAGALHSKAHVAMSCREGAQRNTDEWMINNRAMRVLGYRPDIIRKHDLRFGPATFMCDFHMTLELLKLGYENYIFNWMVNNQPGSNNVPGGCTGQRTPELQTAAAEWLATRHWPFVTLVRKQTKTSWKGEIRTDVRVQWKAAYLSAREAGLVGVLDSGEGQCTAEEGAYSR